MAMVVTFGSLFTLLMTSCSDDVSDVYIKCRSFTSFWCPVMTGVDMLAVRISW